jgi:hypothetical protein
MINVSYNDQPMDHERSSVDFEKTFLECILPPQALPLLVLLLLILPMAILTAESLFIPLFEWLRSLFLSGPEAGATSLPFHFFLKLSIFLVLAFLGVVQLFLRINTLYFSVWAERFSRPHTLHADYHPDYQQSILSLLNWNIFRILTLAAPPLVLGVVTFLVGMLELYLFNLFSGLPFISLPIQFIVALFLMMILSLFTGFAFLNSIWTSFITVFGDVVAVTEPELSAKTIYDRCGRIAFSSPLVYVFYSAYFLFVVGILSELYLLLTTYDIQDLITFHVDFSLLLGMEVLTFALYLILNYLKFLTYHQALAFYYAKLPLSTKEQFTPPPPNLG